MISNHYYSDNIQLFIKKALQWASLFNSACCLHSQEHQLDLYSKFDTLIAAGAADELTDGESPFFPQLQNFFEKHSKKWIPGFLSYDLKNELENLETNHPNEQGFPDAYFFVPKHLILIRGNEVTIDSPSSRNVWEQIINTAVDDSFYFSGTVTAKMSKADYTRAFNKLLSHIQLGNIYEVNLCQEFYAEEVLFEPVKAFWQLSKISPTPFSCFFKQQEQYIISASPERFLARRDKKLISQPMKGTAPRGARREEDQQNIKNLRSNTKEISENIMIVDLVRNDLTRSASPASIHVRELMGVYTFKQVHQLISTVTAEEQPNLPATTSIKNTFPAGSMTGAPKISAMKLIDSYEKSRRGVYAGSIGYFAHDGDYDFNVVIRSLLYNAQNKRLSFHVGSAITAEAHAESEYQECLWKAKAIIKLLGVDVIHNT
ncbi:anthranilate synthase component I family protein [Olivibacter sp. SDN3]|uniref:anthranilate synthase component I family protein n=1 Tax=Olivibacter sp. SDN3 TaxID=2764720 RepID=UPI00165150AA|nr:anthranilate synthase component I family protein [Olivibacter sp. SDN3]QNL49105.1 anthranilate synthase component I family protein [Olivibacter sp. SDN3]